MATIKMNDAEQAAFNARFGSIETESREVKHGKRYENEKLRRAIASLPCIVCGVEGASQHAHANSDCFGKGMGKKSNDYAAFPLCHVGANGCHVAHDENHAELSTSKKIDLEYRYIVQTFGELLRRGLIKL
jgi:hypothetical protein